MASPCHAVGGRLAWCAAGQRTGRSTRAPFYFLLEGGGLGSGAELIGLAQRALLDMERLSDYADLTLFKQLIDLID